MANGGPVVVVDTGFTLGELVALERAIASGARSVAYDGKSVTYGSLDEMLRARRIIMKALGLLDGRSTTILAAHDDGLGGSSTEE